MTILISILTLYSWVLVAALVLILVEIARFYQIKYAELYKNAPSQRTYSSLLVVPLALFMFGAGRYLLKCDLVGDWVGDIAFFAGGLVLAVVAYRLQRLMTGGRR